MHLKNTPREATKENILKELTDKANRKCLPRFKSVHISKKAHNGAANLLSLEHFVLRGCFTTRLFSSCQDHRNPQDALPEKCQHCTNGLQEGRVIFKHLLSEMLPGPFPVGGARVVLFMALFLGHMPSLLSFCCGFPNIMLL